MTKKDALVIVFSCADLYKKNLAGHSYLFVTTDKHHTVHCMEVTFDSSNFLHMTGLKVKQNGITPRHFFSLCCDRRLRESDFTFASDGTAELKLRILPSLVRKDLSVRMVGDYNLAQPKLYTEKIAGSVSACIGFVRDSRSGRYVPNTVLNSDVRQMVKSADRIVLTFRKRREEAQYTEIVYTAKKVEWSAIVLPEPYTYLPLPPQRSND